MYQNIQHGMNTARHGMTRQGMAWHGTAQHGTARSPCKWSDHARRYQGPFENMVPCSGHHVDVLQSVVYCYSMFEDTHSDTLLQGKWLVTCDINCCQCPLLSLIKSCLSFVTGEFLLHHPSQTSTGLLKR